MTFKPAVAGALLTMALGLWPYAASTGAQSPLAGRIAGQPSQMTVSSWYARADPLHIVGPVYFVGTQGLGVYLITSPGGHVLIGGAMPWSSALIEASIRKLGFKPEDIRILLVNHGHIDHAGTTSALKTTSKAIVMAMDGDVGLLASGGSADLVHEGLPWSRYPPVMVDRVLTDGSVIELGDIRITARSTPGHTRGAATFETTVSDGAKRYTVVFADGGLGPGIILDNQASYAGLFADCRRALQVLGSLVPDIWLTYHTEDFEFRAKRVRASSDGARAFMDPAGYARFVNVRQTVLEQILAGNPTRP